MRLSSSIVASLVAVCGVMVGPAAQAAVIYSGTVNLAIPNTTGGLYVNVINGTTYSGPATFPPGSLSDGFNFDFNLFQFGAAWNAFSPMTIAQSSPVPTSSRGYVASSPSGGLVALSPGTLIDTSSVFNTGAPSAAGVTTGASAIFGFRFRNEGSNLSTDADDTVHFGWARVILTAGQPGTLVDYGYESDALTGILAGATGAVAPVPEPALLTTMLTGLVGIIGVARRRRR